MYRCDMDSSSLKENLQFLRLTIPDAARLFQVSDRSVHRWLSGEIDIPGGIARAIEAWVYLEKMGLPWRPDGLPLMPLTPEAVTELKLSRAHAVELAKVLENVGARGGPSAPWVVDLHKRSATLGEIWVKFYPLRNGSFTPQSYGRKDKSLDLVRDRMLLEDAFACIAQAISQARRDLRNFNWYTVQI
jgi:hypothetical protein